MTKAKMFNHLKKINCPIDEATFLKMKKKECEDYHFNYRCTYIRPKKDIKKLSIEQFARIYLRLTNRFVKPKNNKKRYLHFFKYMINSRRNHQKVISGKCKFSFTDLEILGMQKKVYFFQNLAKRANYDK